MLSGAIGSLLDFIVGAHFAAASSAKPLPRMSCSYMGYDANTHFVLWNVHGEDTAEIAVSKAKNISFVLTDNATTSVDSTRQGSILAGAAAANDYDCAFNLRRVTTIVSTNQCHPKETNFRRILDEIMKHVLLLTKIFMDGLKKQDDERFRLWRDLSWGAYFISKESTIENDMDVWSEWFDLLKATLNVVLKKQWIDQFKAPLKMIQENQ